MHVAEKGFRLNPEASNVRFAGFVGTDLATAGNSSNPITGREAARCTKGSYYEESSDPSAKELSRLYALVRTEGTACHGDRVISDPKRRHDIVAGGIRARHRSSTGAVAVTVIVPPTITAPLESRTVPTIVAVSA